MNDVHQPDLWYLYSLMYRSRIFEKAVMRLWKKGLISGEMHLSVGEEAIVAGIVSQLVDGDAMALDHRGTAPLLMRGVDASLILSELMGSSEGLGRGMGGHMHLFSREHLAASSGIVGASGPAGVGFALAASTLRAGTLAVSFFGEGAINQGMLMESFNLASVWNLPILFVCKDNNWAITTQSSRLRGGDICARISGFGIRTWEANGSDVESVWMAAKEALDFTRSRNGPAFLLAKCVHLEGHFMGDPLLDIRRRPLNALRQHIFPILRSYSTKYGLPGAEKYKKMMEIFKTVWEAQKQGRKQFDPLPIARAKLLINQERLKKMEYDIQYEIQNVVNQTVQPTK